MIVRELRNRKRTAWASIARTPGVTSSTASRCRRCCGKRSGDGVSEGGDARLRFELREPQRRAVLHESRVAFLEPIRVAEVHAREERLRESVCGFVWILKGIPEKDEAPAADRHNGN